MADIEIKVGEQYILKEDNALIGEQGDIFKVVRVVGVDNVGDIILKSINNKNVIKCSMNVFTDNFCPADADVVEVGTLAIMDNPVGCFNSGTVWEITNVDCDNMEIEAVTKCGDDTYVLKCSFDEFEDSFSIVDSLESDNDIEDNCNECDGECANCRNNCPNNDEYGYAWTIIDDKETSIEYVVLHNAVMVVSVKLPSGFVITSSVMIKPDCGEDGEGLAYDDCIHDIVDQIVKHERYSDMWNEYVLNKKNSE